MADEGETANQAGGDEVGDKWGDPISEVRQAELRDLFERQMVWAAQSEATRGDSVFKGVKLTGADVYWLAEWSGSDRGRLSSLHLEGAEISGHLERAHLVGAHLERAWVGGHLEGADLREAHLEGAVVRGHLVGADLSDAHLEGAHAQETRMEAAVLNGAHLEGALLSGVHLEGADLSVSQAHLKGTVLNWSFREGAYLLKPHEEAGFPIRSAAHLEGADLFRAHLEGAFLRGTHLEGADLREAHLEGQIVDYLHLKRIRETRQTFPDVLPPADLRFAYFDRSTQLQGATLGDAALGLVRMADTHWGEVNLGVVDWPERAILRDERVAMLWKPIPPMTTEWGKRPTRKQRREVLNKQHEQHLSVFREATRANRQLAAVLRNQGLNDEADRYAYRAQLVQRAVLRLRRRWGAALGSWLLDAVSGYGYKPVRSVIAYIAIILFFAGLYLLNGQFAAPHLRWDEALVLSISSFHGRGFFTTDIHLGDTLARLAAGEAIVGLLLEITFIATFTQRFFAR